ncbi:hypothetical protein AJ87_47680 [Rhizobium yanglingense]|nr:hypothetical protein AJ87_47680 [Rhizobium yanglingense]
MIAGDQDMSYKNIMTYYYDPNYAEYDTTAQAPYLSPSKAIGRSDARSFHTRTSVLSRPRGNSPDRMAWVGQSSGLWVRDTCRRRQTRVAFCTPLEMRFSIELKDDLGAG